MNSPGTEQRVDSLLARFNEEVIPRRHIRRWLDRFPDEDKPAALTLLEKIEFHSYPRLVRECRELHARLREELRAADGFDNSTFSDVDFSREFTCKSGDIISYIYRKATAVSPVDFRNFNRLVSLAAESPGLFSDGALVILDDFIGTGSQFIFQFLARSREDIAVLNAYRRVYLASVVIHDNALEKLALLRQGECRRVLAIEEAGFPDYNWQGEEQDLEDALCTVDWSRIAFFWVEREHPLLSPENRNITGAEREVLAAFLCRYGVTARSPPPTSTATTPSSTGHQTPSRRSSSRSSPGSRITPSTLPSISSGSQGTRSAGPWTMGMSEENHDFASKMGIPARRDVGERVMDRLLPGPEHSGSEPVEPGR